tara:strand:+ start:3401 stop:4357 length:957 start_codon:yes stop_codon:yes gene_type:complete
LGNLKHIFSKNTVGFESFEDCSVFPLDDDTYLIQSVDFFTPIVDDPFTFGKIAAVNSISDIYAMGGTPLYALNIAEFPSEKLPLEVLSSILEGGLKGAKEAGIPILGGHTIKDSVPKYGLVVTGKVNKNDLTLNSNALPGDDLIITKPIGTGIISTAIKENKADSRIIDSSINVMEHLNKGAALAMNKVGVSACTDITGYGFLGHLNEMCAASNVSANINFNEVPFINGVSDLANQGFIPGGTKRNLEFISDKICFKHSIQKYQKLMLADAQTSGGLLISLPSNKTQDLIHLLNKNKCLSYTKIGHITNPGKKRIYIN